MTDQLHAFLVMTVQWLLLSRRRFDKMVISQSGMSTAQFLRLLLMVVILAVSTACSCIFQLIVNLKQADWSPNPYVSWTHVHHSLGVIYQMPTALVSPFARMIIWAFFMFAPYAGSVFFLFFGLSGGALSALKRVMGYKGRVPHRSKVREGEGRPSNMTNSDPGQLCVHLSYLPFLVRMLR